jgi:hypothetical protein
MSFTKEEKHGRSMREMETQRFRKFFLKSQKYQSDISRSFKLKSWQLCSVWRWAKLNNVRHDDDEDDYGGDDDDGNSVTYEWL